MSNFVRIQSKMTINVTPGLNYQDVTNYESDIPNRMKVAATWPKAAVQIKEGVNTYPEEIVEWATVKALAKAGVITIGGQVEETDLKKIESQAELQRTLEQIEEPQSQPRQRRRRNTLQEAAE